MSVIWYKLPVFKSLGGFWVKGRNPTRDFGEVYAGVYGDSNGDFMESRQE
jgi:hypothetical protein